MKKVLFFLISMLVSMLVLVACNDEDDAQETSADKAKATEKVENSEENDVDVENDDEKLANEEEQVNEDNKEETASIDTSMYEYSPNVEVTDAIDINNHITLMIDMNDNLEAGLAFMHATNQTLDFIEQNNMENVETIGVNVRLNEIKIAMFTVHPNEIENNENESMANIVLNASDVEMISPEVEDFANNMELNIE